jgi:hypothetical protein
MKMKTYELRDGGNISANSPEALVMTLRQSGKFDSECTNEEYMKRFAERYKIQTGEAIKADNSTVFVEELLRVGFLILRGEW